VEGIREKAMAVDFVILRNSVFFVKGIRGKAMVVDFVILRS